MKLATLADGGRDGRLAVVSRDLQRAPARVPASRRRCRPRSTTGRRKARARGARARAGRRPRRRRHAFDPAQCAAPLPRAYHWVDGSAYVNHVELVRKARGADMPAVVLDRSAVYQGGSDDLLGPRDADRRSATKPGASTSRPRSRSSPTTCRWASTPTRARGHIKLLMLVNDWSLRNLIPGELAKGFGFYQSKPATAFSPVAVTPDELGEAWNGRQGPPAAASAHSTAQLFGRPECGHRHDVRLRPADRARGEDAPPRRRHHRRLRHGLEPRPQPRARAASPSGACSRRSSRAGRGRRS